MKLTKILHQLRIQFRTQLPGYDIVSKIVLPLVLLSLCAAWVWLYGAEFKWQDSFPLVQHEKRIYVILAMYAVWLLKILLLDLNIPNPFTYKDAETRKRLAELQSRFNGALDFLKKTKVSRSDDNQHLSDLPCYLLIGPAQAGKTTLLAHANVHYVLQRQFPKKDLQNLSMTENCEWWVTRDLSIIDVPGKYISAKGYAKNYKMYPALWRFFLRLLRKNNGKKSIRGIIIALPLPEIMKGKNGSRYQIFLNELFPRIAELRKMFPQTLPCQIIITKCDLLPGFNEFFAESNNDECNQAWGINLTDKKAGTTIPDLFNHRFDVIIKKLNQQLIWRIHQERNPLARPYIKDFPLQIQRLKETLGEFVKQYCESVSHIPLHGVYLTSAMQVKTEPEATVIDHNGESSERGLQLFKPPQPLTRPYFIKQFIALGLHNERTTTIVMTHKWKQRSAIAASITAILGAGYLLGHDFQLGIQQAYSIQNNIAEYQVTLLRAKDPDDQLMKTVELMNSLRQIAKNNEFRLDLKHLLSFYSYKSQQKATMVYQQALQTILLPEIKSYIGQYLKNPVNKNNDLVYAAFKAYLMLGDPTHLQPDYVKIVMHYIAPKSMPETDQMALKDHLTSVFNTKWPAMNLDRTTIDDTRRYLTAIPRYDLSYIILKTYDDNNLQTSVDLGMTGKAQPIFVLQHLIKPVPVMFTAKNFSSIYTHQATKAATEAMSGNWVLGESMGPNIRPDTTENIVEQLRNSYVNNYVDTWEDLMDNLHLVKSTDLKTTNDTIAVLISDESPLLRFLQTIHDNTYFEPVISASPKLQQVGALVDKNTESQQKLYQLFSVLRSLHSFIQNIQNASNEPKAAFEAVSKRMQNQAEPDMLTQLRIVANNSPEPIKGWLINIADDTWRYLMQDGSRYINTAWEREVMTPYRNTIADRYPFSKNVDRDVELNKFVSFFGNPGTLLNFYHQYLEAFVDTNSSEWRWRMMDNNKMPFPNATLHQIQLGMRIHHTFFPNGDDKMYVQFAISPHKFGKNIKSVKLNINDKAFVDNDTKTTSPHMASWPSTASVKMAAVQLRTKKDKQVNRTYLGDWAWFKLVAHSVQNMVSKKELMLNFAKNGEPVQYLLFTESNFNPFLSLNLNRLKFPDQLTTTTSEGSKDV